jgi:hypothetical protein
MYIASIDPGLVKLECIALIVPLGEVSEAVHDAEAGSMAWCHAQRHLTHRVVEKDCIGGFTACEDKQVKYMRDEINEIGE